ncbi:hypothetical protein [Nocardia salmonicida]
MANKKIGGFSGPREYQRGMLAALVCCAIVATGCGGGEESATPTSSAVTTTVAVVRATTAPATTLGPQTPIAAPPESSLLIGAWQSVKDPTDIRTFNADGTTTDQAGQTDPWRARWDWVSGEGIPDVPNVYTGPILRLIDDDASPSGRKRDLLYFYAVIFDSPDHLKLGYFNGLGHTLEYTRVS